MKVYIICPVRNATEEQIKELRNYMEELGVQGDEVFYPNDHAPQDDKTGWGIVSTELNAIKWCDEVHVYWDVESKGSHFDLGMTMALNKPIKLIHLFQEDPPYKSYVKVIGEYSKNRLNSTDKTKIL